MSNITFRKAKQEDLQKVFDMCRILAAQPGSPWDDEYPAMSNFEETLSFDGLYIAEDGPEIVATCGIEPAEDTFIDEAFWNRSHKTPCVGARLGVHPDYQGRHLAQKMVEFALKGAKEDGFDSIHFYVDPDNEKALKLYKRMGFEFVGEADWIELHWFAFEKTL